MRIYGAMTNRTCVGKDHQKRARQIISDNKVTKWDALDRGNNIDLPKLKALLFDPSPLTNSSLRWSTMCSTASLCDWTWQLCQPFYSTWWNPIEVVFAQLVHMLSAKSWHKNYALTLQQLRTDSAFRADVLSNRESIRSPRSITFIKHKLWPSSSTKRSMINDLHCNDVAWCIHDKTCCCKCVHFK